MRSIIHLDADAFFASVEQAADSRLRGRPIAVGGEKRGIIASASYEARQMGIYTPMPSVMARRLCPKLVLLPGDFEKYELFSRLMFSYAYDFTPDVEIGSIDEGYLDLTGARKPPIEIATTIRNAIRQALKLSVSEGVASNKLISQVASKLKKPFGFEFVPPGNEAAYLAPLANKWLPGIGPKTAIQLNSAGLARIGQIAQTPGELLGLLVGRMAPQLHEFARGIDPRPVIPVRAPAKSYGEQETFGQDTTDEPFLEATLRRMADKLMAKVRDDGKSIRTLTVKVRYNDMDEQQASESLPEPTDVETDIYDKVSALLSKAWQRRVSLRLVSLKLSNIYDGRFFSELGLDICARRHSNEQRLAGVVDDLRQKFGRTVLLRGHDFILRERRCRTEAAANANQHSAEQSNRRDPQQQHSETPPLHHSSTPTSSASSYGKLILERQRLANSIAMRSLPDQKPVVQIKADLNLQVQITERGCVVLDQPQHVAAQNDVAKYKNPLAKRSGSAIPAPARSSTCCGWSRTTQPRSVFTPLNIHSYYSFLDSTLSIKAIIDLAKRHELPAIALTDTNNLHGAVEFAQAAADAGIKPIIGAQIDFHGHRVCLYVENQTGYHTLCRILTRTSPDKLQKQKAKSEGASSPTLLPFADFFPSTDGLLAVSPNPALARLFPQRFYLQTNSFDAFKDRPGSARTLPCVAALPLHYELPADRWKFDIVQSIRTLTLLRQAHPEKRLEGDGDFHFRSAAEMTRLFGSAAPELLAHSREVADRCSFQFSFGKPQFPSYSPPGGLSPAAFLRHLVMDGLRRRYPKEHAKLKPQLEQELAIITDVGYEEYFLVMWDILQECRRRGIDWITRGSAADSLACYCLEISGVCPIRFDLYFRRFLNKERMALNKLPDIDVDFPHDRKDDVIDLIFEKFGTANTAVVGGFSTFQARSAFAEVAKVLGVSDFQVRRITERFPHFARSSELGEAVADTQECRDLPLGEEPFATALKMGQFLDGFPRYAKMHPCGLVLSRQPMQEITPCFTSAKGYPTTHFDMDSVEAVGLIKMDILAQGGLAVMRDVTTHPTFPGSADLQSALPTFDWTFLEPWHDPEVWDLIASGNARAVHHIESPAMISLCKMCNVRDIDTLIAIVSVIRPGAANESKKMEFARRYQGLSPIRYPHPSLERCLRSTYGLVVYEEHILQICEAFAGLPPGRADVLRRALGKNKTETIAQIETEFIDCARKRGRAETEIKEVWDLVVGFRGYAFCKAHSTAYGVEAFQAAWLKRYYPAHFMAAVLTNGKGFYSPLVYILECHRLGIPLLPPSINHPGPAFGVERQKIRIPVLQIKGLTERTKETLLREYCHRGTFSSLTDFFLRVHPLPEEMDALIRIGAFDEFGQSRTTQYWQFKSLDRTTPERGCIAVQRDQPQHVLHEAAPLYGNQCQPTHIYAKTPGQDSNPSIHQSTNPSQLWLLPPGNLDRLESVPLDEPTRLARLQAEEELLGYPASGHPLDLFPNIAWNTYCPINRLSQFIGQQIVTCGLVIEQRLFHQVTGEPMKFITIADRTGIIETELFAKTYKSYGLNTVRYRVLEISATVEPFENGRGYTLRVLRADKPREKSLSPAIKARQAR